MQQIHPQFIKDTAGKGLVVLPQTEFEKIMEDLDELEDIKLYDASKKRKQTFIEANEAFKMIEVKRKKNV